MSKRRSFLLLSFLITASAQLSAFQWPSDPRGLAGTFALPAGDSVFKGLSFEQVETVNPFDQGRVVYKYEPDPFSPSPFTDSALLVLEHDNGFQSIYRGLPPGSVEDLPDRVSPSDYLYRGEDPLSEYCFTIRDARLGRLVNPLLLLPGLNDSVPPRLEEVLLVDSNGAEFLISPDRSVPAGVYKAFLHVEDRFSSRDDLLVMPFSVSLYNLGTLLAQRRLDSLVQRDNTIALQDGVSVEDVFNAAGYLFLGDITLNSGTASLEVVMEDFFGNESIETFSFRVLRQ